MLSANKVTSEHLRRDAYLYVRQSSLQQVQDHRESTARQYALQGRAQALGWASEQTVVIDEDQGLSGASAVARTGFQRLVAEVGLGHVGLVMGLEVSRLARNSADWHRLLEICALAETLILDEDGLYDPSQFNDRLLLGLKGTMSEAELHVLRARLLGGTLNKARRGELWIRPPIGLVYDRAQGLMLEPDAQIQGAVRLLFATFRRTGSAEQVVRHFAREGVRWPRRLTTGPRAGEVGWGRLEHSRVLDILHNPRYAGAFVYGRRRQRKVGVTGQPRYRRLPQAEWKVFLPNAHPGYLSWEEFETNQATLRANAQSRGLDRRRSPAREGVALLQGLVICGRCGERMTVRYIVRQGHPAPYYVCQREGIATAQRICERLPGVTLDDAVAEAMLAAVTPAALEVALEVCEELRARKADVDRLRRAQVDRAREEAELAQRQFLLVRPEHRLVADSLERQWNEALMRLAAAEEEYRRATTADAPALTGDDRARIHALASDLPRVWHDPRTAMRERKRMLRLLIEDVTLLPCARDPDPDPLEGRGDDDAGTLAPAERARPAPDPGGHRRADSRAGDGPDRSAGGGHAQWARPPLRHRPAVQPRGDPAHPADLWDCGPGRASPSGRVAHRHRDRGPARGSFHHRQTLRARRRPPRRAGRRPRPPPLRAPDRPAAPCPPGQAICWPSPLSSVCATHAERGAV